MSIELIGIIISAVVSIGVTLITNAKSDALQTERISVLQNQMKELSDRVDKHNNFGIQLAKLETRIELLEKK